MTAPGGARAAVGRDALVSAVSWLFVPASRPDRYARAVGSGADAVIVDLEDAVAASGKRQAREDLCRHWPATDGDSAPVVVRVNAEGTPYHLDDLAACEALAPDAVVLSKAESAAQVRAVAEACGAPVLPLVETARGLVNLPGIVSAPDVVRLLFGSIDLALDLGVTDDAALDTARADLVRWAAACGLPQPVDGVTTAVRDAAAVTRAAERSAAWGFGGKLCIHPAQLGPVRAAFAPCEDDLRWARRVLDAVEDTRRAGRPVGDATMVDGEMIDRPLVERARRLVRRAEHGPR